ncbi:MAG: phenylalanine--tRNA ligase subunit alpha [Nitriliruptorales bacterium]
MTEAERDADRIERLRTEALAAIDAAADLDALEDARVAFTGRKSPLAEIQRGLKDLDPDARAALGRRVNEFRDTFEARLGGRREELRGAELDARLREERLDLTLPPRHVPPGRPHLLTQVADEIVGAFVGLGYRVAEGPEVEAARFNFDLLNIPPDHPARLEMDTVYVADDIVLRTHTSPVQARVMVTQPPPIAVVVPGRVFRNDAPDATHSPVFQQVEGLAVAEGLTMAHLRGTLLEFAHALFGLEREVRLRPSFFPFTEPSAEVDVSCPFCAGDGSPCRVCSGTGWIELLGAGMVDPNVLDACGLDPRVHSGFAFGIGIERVAMMRHGVPDVRMFYENDARFLERF